MNQLSCEVAAEYGREARRGRLGDAEAQTWAAHLATCEGCREEHRREGALDAALGRLPRPAAPAALTARLQALITADAQPAKDAAELQAWRDAEPARPTRSRQRTWRWVAAAAAVAAAALVLLLARPYASNRGQMLLAEEAVSDHLRILYADRGPEIESGGIHQVKPWFEGRVDFAPVVPFDGDADFPLQGGSVAYYIDRKAAAFVYKRNLHNITLFVFPARDLPWPKTDRITSETRGFHVVVWRAGDLGYALVSDVAMNELTTLEHKLH